MIDPAKTCSLGALLVGGDWAIAHGDADGLAHVAAALGARLRGPRKSRVSERRFRRRTDRKKAWRQADEVCLDRQVLSAELDEVLALCATSYQSAVARWFTLHDTLERALIEAERA